MKAMKTCVAVAAMVALSGTAYAAPVFQGRLADGTASATCTVSGANKCAMFYYTTLDITILNDWKIGQNVIFDLIEPVGWRDAQALAETAGAAQTDFTGWFLPTGDGDQAAGPLNQYRSIWNAVGGSLAGLQNQFDGVQSYLYWSRTPYAPYTGEPPWLSDPSTSIGGAWFFDAVSGNLTPTHRFLWWGMWAVAVRPGDVAPSHTEVSIDIKPGSFPNSIDPRSKGVVPVAILSTNIFNAITVDPASVYFGAVGTEATPLRSAREDVDHDGVMDMIFHFRTQDTGIICGTTSASLKGNTFGGQMIKGTDSVNTVGCK